MTSSKVRRAAWIVVVSSLTLTAVLAVAWIRGDGRTVTAVLTLWGIGGLAVGVWLVRNRAHKALRALGLVVCLLAFLTATFAGLYMRGNWDYFEGRVRMNEANYIAAINSYADALDVIDTGGAVIAGPPFRLRLTSEGIVQDTRVQIYSDLGWIASRDQDWATASSAYSLALSVAKSEGHDASVIRDIEDALRDLEGSE